MKHIHETTDRDGDNFYIAESVKRNGEELFFFTPARGTYLNVDDIIATRNVLTGWLQEMSHEIPEPTEVIPEPAPAPVAPAKPKGGKA